MTDWTLGYRADIDYTYGYYSELNPLRAQTAFHSAGLSFPEVQSACELGFGLGVSINIHAAATGADWYGTDFNPAQAGYARELAGAGEQLRLSDQAFADFCQRTDLPDFDFIGLHGIWSWIDDANRAAIVDFLRRKLTVGGVLYISYNTLPGWSGFGPMRHLLTQHAKLIGAEGQGIVKRIDDALEFADGLIGVNPAFARAYPQLGERLKSVRQQNRHYLAHEYFNREWEPMHFAAMAEWLQPAKLTYACSAHLLDHVDAINLTAEQQAFLSSVPDPTLKESVKDFIVNQQFRRDYWVKGARKLSPLEQVDALRQQAFVLVAPRNQVVLKVTGAMGEASLHEKVYVPILDALSDHKPKTVGRLAEQLKDSTISFAQLVQALTILTGAGHLSLAQGAQRSAEQKKACDKLNAQLLRQSRSRGEVNSLASPLTGGGVQVGRLSQLFMLARLHGAQEPHQWAQHAWSWLDANGQKVIKEGAPLLSAESNLSELQRLAALFAENELPVLKALQVA